MKRVDLAIGVALTLTVHGIMGASAYYYDEERPPRAEMPSKISDAAPWGLCGERRCPHGPARHRRRKPEPPPPDELEILEAALVPKLGYREPDPSALPKLQTYEQPEVMEEVVNPYVPPEPKPPENVKQAFDPKPAKRDPKSDSDLKKILAIDDDDPRKRASRLENIVGSADGEVGGQATILKAGNAYSREVSRKLRQDFVVPPFLDRATLTRLQTRIKVTGLAVDGAIRSYRVLRRSGNRAFDDAAVAAINRYTPKEGGSKRLPVPDPDVLNHINSKGMVITMDGRLLSR